MNDIDDNYQQESEDIDNNFLEKIKDSKNRGSEVKKYLEDMKKSRDKFEKGYEKNLAKEKKAIWNKKKVVEKKEKFQHMNVKHFNFKFSWFERLKMKADVDFFEWGRGLSRSRSRFLPRWLIYFYYKVVKTIRVIFINISEWITKGYNNIKEGIVALAVWIREFLKNIWSKISMSFSFVMDKILFWRKSGSKKGDEKGEGKKDREDKEKP